MDNENVLESWKEIAAYLGRSVRTCQQWERKMGLPIHRFDGSQKGRVYVRKDELDRWLEEKLYKGKRTSWPGLIERLGGNKGRTFALFFIVTAAALVVAFGWRRVSLAKIQSVAVLPFVDLSPDHSWEYLAHGMPETLVKALGRFRNLRVPPATLSSSFMRQKIDIQEIARSLDVKHILEGSILTGEKSTELAVRLVDAEAGFELWASSYELNADGLSAIQDDIVRAVCGRLGVRLPEGEDRPRPGSSTPNPKAYYLYLLGHHFFERRQKEDLFTAIDFFRKAAEADETFAPAYAGLAQTYAVLGDNLIVVPSESFPKAKEFALKALSIDNGLPQAYIALAMVKHGYEWDFAAAEEYITQALRLDPNDAFAHLMYGYELKDMGRHDEALKEIKLSQDLNPLDPRTRANIGLFYYFARRYQEAEKALRESLEFDPSHCMAHRYLTFVLVELGRYQEALESEKSYYACAGRPISTWTAYVYARCGKEREARKILSGYEERAKKDYVWLTGLAIVYGALGENDAAFDLLERSRVRRDNKLTQLMAAPHYDSLRSDPRFKTLIEKIGFPEVAR